MIVYLDTSTVLRVLLRQPKVLGIWGRWERAYTSELLHVEARRVTRPVLQRAQLPMATVVKTLDAIHLASALLLRERRSVTAVFATHDPQQARGARALGFECVGV